MKSGWQTRTLGDICVVDWGNTDLTKSAYVEGGQFLAVSAAGCDGRIAHKEHSKYTPVLSAIGAQCGRMFLPEEDFTAIKNTITLTPRDGACTGQFLYQLLTHVELPKRGAAQPFISKGDIQAFQVPVPPLHEQRRIVGILDEAFAGIATAKANAEKNLRNARELFESYLNSVFSQRGEGWVEKRLGEACILRSGTTLSRELEKPSGEIPYLKVADMNLGENTHRVTSSSRYVDKDKVNASNLLPSGTTIFPKRGGAILTNKKRLTSRVICADLNIMGVTPEQGLLPEFLYNYFLRLDLREIDNGSSIPQINNYSIEPLLISFPVALAVQQSIVDKLESLSAETKRLEDIVQRKLVALEALKKSLLHRAFSGEL